MEQAGGDPLFFEQGRHLPFPLPAKVKRRAARPFADCLVGKLGSKAKSGQQAVGRKQTQRWICDTVIEDEP